MGFPGAMPRRTSHASDTGFSLGHIPVADAAADCRFFLAWNFSQSASGENITGVDHGTLVSARFF